MEQELTYKEKVLLKLKELEKTAVNQLKSEKDTVRIYQLQGRLEFTELFKEMAENDFE